MNCDLYRSEMYAWRPGSDEKTFQPLFDHLDTCAECARFFEQLKASDEHIRRTFQGYAQSPFLESRILSGLAHQRAQVAARRPGRRLWMLAPAFVALLIVLFVWAAPWLQLARVNREMAILLSKPPALEINSTDRKQLLEWSASQLEGSPTLPAELDKVKFRGAAAISVAAHKAVLLKMKNEERASLVIVDAPLTQDSRFHSMHEGSGSASLWSDGRRSYVLLFNGSDQELHAYMTRMGIIA
jgi:anti-sigma factor RsiW